MKYHIVGRSLNLKQTTTSNQDLIELARNGLNRSAVDSLAKKLQISVRDLASYLHISERNLQRYTLDQELSSNVSDRLIQIAKVYAKAVDVFEDEEAAVAWLKYPSQALGGITPLSCLDNFSGIELVTDELGRIDYGVYA